LEAALTARELAPWAEIKHFLTAYKLFQLRQNERQYRCNTHAEDLLPGQAVCSDQRLVKLLTAGGNEARLRQALTVKVDLYALR